MTTFFVILAMALFLALIGGLHVVANAGGTRAQRDMSKARKQRAQRIAMAHARAMDEHAEYMATRSQRARNDYPFHNA